MIVRSVIKTRRKNIGTDKEFINEDPETSDFYIDEDFEGKGQDKDNQIGIERLDSEELNNENNIDDNEEQENDNIPPEEATNIEDITTIYDEFDSRDKELDQMEFNSILEQKFTDGVLILAR